MRQITIILAVTTFLLSSCLDAPAPPTVKKRKYTLSIHSGEGMSSGYSEIECDSFTMINKKECIFWSNGSQAKIIATDILPNSN